MACPWNVESLEDFLYYCCPECNDRHQSRDDFLQHALKEHPDATNYLVPIYVKNEYDDENYDIANADTKDINLKKGVVSFEDPLYVIEKQNQNNIKLEVGDEDINAYLDTSMQEEEENISDQEEMVEAKFKEDQGDDENISTTNCCEECGKTYSTAGLLKRHNRKVHGKGMFECKKCPKKFGRRIRLKEHVKNVHFKQKLRYQCDFKDCEASFNTLSELKGHKQIDHEGDEMNYSCQHCDYKSNNKRRFNVHVSSIHENKRWPCSECGKDFTEERAMKAHVKNIHEQILDYICEEIGCNKRYSNSSQLKNHIDRFHKQVRDHVCDHCGKFKDLHFFFKKFCSDN